MTIDFFVHPGHEFNYHKQNSNGNYQKYLDNLTSVLKNSEFPILIGKEDIFKYRFPEEHILDDASFWIYETPIDKGEIGPESWEKFLLLIKGKESAEMRVHGSYFGECVEGFAVQLFAYLHRGEHWNNWQCWLPSINSQQDKEIKIRKQHELDGDFKKSNIKYGNVLAGLNRKAKPIFPINLFPFGRRKNGNITYQLLDNKSRLYRV